MVIKCNPAIHRICNYSVNRGNVSVNNKYTQYIKNKHMQNIIIFVTFYTQVLSNMCKVLLIHPTLYFCT